MQIHIVVDGVGKVCQLTGSGIAEDEVLAQAGIRLTYIEVLIGNAVDGLFASHLHAGPVTVQVVGIAPHVEIQSIPARLVVNKHGITVVLHAGFQPDLFDTVGSDAQIDVTLDGEVEVGQLHACTAIIEDQILNESCVCLTHVEVFPSDTVVIPSASDAHAGPVTVQVVDVAPHVEGKHIPARLVIDIYGVTVVLWLRSLATTPVVTLPALAPDVGKGADTRIVGMQRLIACSGELLALVLGEEAETVGQRLAAYESAGVEIDAPLDIAVGSLCQQILRIANSLFLAVEGSGDIDLLVGSGAEGGNELQQDTVGPCLKLLTLMVERDVFVALTACQQPRQGQQT